MTYREDPYVERRETVLASPSPTVVTPATPVVDGVTPVAMRPATVVTEQPAYVPAPVHAARTDRVARWAPDAIVSAGAGLVLLLIGLLAVTRAGFAGPLTDPVVSVLGFRHTAALGLIEIGFGLALLSSGASRSRASELFFGSVLGIGGFVAAVQAASFHRSLAVESGFAWLVTIGATIVVVASLVLPTVVHRSTVVDQS